jgi:hypothetical protein
MAIVSSDDGSLALADGLICTNIKGESEPVMKKLGLGLGVALRSDPLPGGFPGSGSNMAKPQSVDHTPLGGLVSRTSEKPNVLPAFQLVCMNCDALASFLIMPKVRRYLPRSSVAIATLCAGRLEPCAISLSGIDALPSIRIGNIDPGYAEHGGGRPSVLDGLRPD